MYVHNLNAQSGFSHQSESLINSDHFLVVLTI